LENLSKIFILKNESTQPGPMIIDNQQEEEEAIPSTSTLQKERINKNKSSSNHHQPSLTSEINENNQINSIDKPYIATTTVEHQSDYITRVKPLTNNLTEQIEYQLEEWYINLNENSNDLNDTQQL
jgi:hypothetical protein